MDAEFRIVPLTTDPNQNFVITLPIDGKNITFDLTISYNNQGRFWWMKVVNGDTNETIIEGLPIVYSENPAADIFEQFEYLNIGSAIVVKTSDIKESTPDGTNLGTDFILLWGDTIV